MLVVASVAPFWRAVDAGFFSDDYHLILQDPRVTDHRGGLLALVSQPFGPRIKQDPRPFYRPLVTASLRLNHLFSGDRPRGYHLFNLLLHALVTLGVLLAARRFFGLREGPALAAALVFAVHPVHVPSVMWISGRTDLLCALFLLGAALLHAANRRGGGHRWPGLAAAICLLLALGAKEAALLLVPALLLWECAGADWSARQLSRSLDRRHYVAMAALLAAFWGVHAWLTDPIGDLGFQQLTSGLARAPLALAGYLKALVLPLDLHGFYVTAPEASALELAGAAAAVVALTALLVLARRRRPILLGGGWYLLFLLPGLGIVPLSSYARADHLQYIASIGGIVALVGLIDAVLSRLLETAARTVVAVVLALLAAGALTAGTLGRAEVWSDEALTYTDLIERYPRFTAGRAALGAVLLRRGDLAGAGRVYAAGLKLTPGEGRLWLGLAQVSIRRRQFDLAERQLKAALGHGLDSSEAHNNLANCYFMRGELVNARVHYRRALRLDPANYTAMYNLGRTLERQGRRIEALGWYRRFIRRAPASFAAQKATLRRRHRSLAGG